MSNNYNNKSKGKTNNKYSRNKSNGKFDKSKSYDKSNKMAGRNPDTVGENNIAHNDIGWYLKQPQMLADAGTLSFANYTGVPVDLYPEDDFIETKQTAFPSAMVLHYTPTFGSSNNAVSALNLAARDIYGFVRKENAGAKNYDTPDLMLYIIAMEQMHAAIAWAKRIYGLASLYYFSNRSVPTAYFDAMGVDFYSITENLADFRYRLNTIINRANIMYLPNRYTILDRHKFLNENMFMDSPVTKAHIYMFNPTYFGKYSAMVGDVARGQIIAVPTYPTEDYWKYTDICDMLDDMLNAILSDQDMAIMNGDIIKAYNGSGFIQIPIIEADYKCEPVYAPNVLPQIENATIVGMPVYETNGNGAWVMVDQNPKTNNLLTTNQFAIEFTDLSGALSIDDFTFTADVVSDVWKGCPMIDMPMDNPTAADVMVATRLTVSPDEVGFGGTQVIMRFDHVGSEVVSRVEVLSPLMDDDPTVVNYWNKFNVPSYYTIGIATQGDVLAIITGPSFGGFSANHIAAITKFNHHPHLRYVVLNTNGAESSVFGASVEFETGSVTNFALIAPVTLNKLHDLAIMGEFDVPARM